MRREAFVNDGKTPTIEDAPDLMLWDTTLYTDWQKTLIGSSASYTNINAGISGGTAALRYLFKRYLSGRQQSSPGSLPIREGSIHFNINSTSPNQKFNFSVHSKLLV